MRRNVYKSKCLNYDSDSNKEVIAMQKKEKYLK